MGWLSDLVDNTQREVKNVSLGDLINVGTQYLTFGLVGYDKKKGKLEAGFLAHAADEGVGELTGRNRSRAALNFAREQFDEQKKQAENLRQQQLWQAKNNDIQASNLAAAQARSSSQDVNFTNKTPLGLGANGFQPAQKDFLGL